MEGVAKESYSPDTIADMENVNLEVHWDKLKEQQDKEDSLSPDEVPTLNKILSGRGWVITLLRNYPKCGPALAFVQRNWEVLKDEATKRGAAYTYIGGAMNASTKNWIEKYGENDRFYFNQLIEGILHEVLPFSKQAINDISAKLLDATDNITATALYPLNFSNGMIATPQDFRAIDNDPDIQAYFEGVRKFAFQLTTGDRTPCPMVTPQGSWAPFNRGAGQGRVLEGNNEGEEAGNGSAGQILAGLGISNEGEGGSEDGGTIHANENQSIAQSIEGDEANANEPESRIPSPSLHIPSAQPSPSPSPPPATIELTFHARNIRPFRLRLSRQTPLRYLAYYFRVKNRLISRTQVVVLFRGDALMGRRTIGEAGLRDGDMLTVRVNWDDGI